jgi:hypothetical protein
MREKHIILRAISPTARTREVFLGPGASAESVSPQLAVGIDELDRSN